MDQVATADLVDYVLACPKCQATFKIVDQEIDLPVSFTCDCPTCKKLLLVENGVVSDFHQAIHSRDPRWPVDGKDTQYIEF